MAEINIEVDENDKEIGVRPREDFYTGNYIHRASHLILFNSKNEILLQHRAPTKKWFPNLYTYSVSGTVGQESYEECIYKEMQEEIGLTIPVKELFRYSFFNEKDKAWRCVFVGTSDREIIPDKREIQRILWMNVDLLQEDIKQHPEKYTPPCLEGLKLFFSKYYPVKNM